MDRNGDGVVTFEEFLETCQKVSSSKVGGFGVIAILLLLTARPPSLRHNLIPRPIPKRVGGGRVGNEGGRQLRSPRDGWAEGDRGL